MMVALSPREIELLLIVGVALTAILGNRQRHEVGALLVLLALGISGILTPADLTQTFQLTERLWEVQIHPDSPEAKSCQGCSAQAVACQLGRYGQAGRSQEDNIRQAHHCLFR
jgi:hypothetical protein